ncbi:MAG: HD domain-containing protein [Fimbriimonadales bacterium]
MARRQLLHDALRFAVEAHDGQARDGDYPLPYATHPVEVVANLRYVGNVVDEDILCAGFLHDVLEETSATEEEIERLFGKRVRELVVSVRREEPSTKQVAGLDKDGIYALRSRMLLDEIAAMSPESQTIKLADRLSNVVGVHATREGRKLKRYIEQTENLLRIIPRKVNPALWDAVKEEAAKEL